MTVEAAQERLQSLVEHRQEIWQVVRKEAEFMVLVTSELHPPITLEPHMVIKSLLDNLDAEINYITHLLKTNTLKQHNDDKK